MGKNIPIVWIRFVKNLHALSGKSKAYVFISIAFLALFHLYLSVHCKDFNWFAAFGGLLSLFGLLVSLSYAVPLEEINPIDLEPTKDGDTYVEGGSSWGNLITDTKEIEEIKNKNVSAVLKNYENISLYIIFSATGTVIWAYSGFLNKIFFVSPL